MTQIPVLYWNAQHDWISFRFQLGDRFAAYGDQSNHYSFSLLFGVIAAQVGYLFPSIALPLWWTSLKALVLKIRQRFIPLGKQTTASEINSAPSASTKVTFLLWSGLPVSLGFTLIGGATHTFPAWPAPGLWSLTLLLGYAAAQWRSRSVKRWLWGTGWIVGTVLIFALTHITIGTLQKSGDYALFGGVVAIEEDPSTELIDTVQLRRLLVQSTEFESEIASTDFIITPDFWLSGYLAMALPKMLNVPIGSFTTDPRGQAFWLEPAAWVGKDALLVSLETMDKNSQGEEESRGKLDAIAPYFQSVTPVAKIATYRGGEVSKTFYYYRAKNLLRLYLFPF